MSLPLTPDIGAPVIDRASKFQQAVLDYVIIEGSNPATKAGKITKFAFYLDPSGTLGSTYIGTLYRPDPVGFPNKFTARNWVPSPSVVDGYNEVDVNLTVEVGDFVGLGLIRDNALELGSSGGVAIWYVQIAHGTPLNNTTCTYLANNIVSVGGEITASPTVTTDPATSIQKASATLNGTLNDDGGEACNCGFEYGPTVAYGTTTPTQSRTTGQTFAQAIAGLDPNKTYHFRALATNSAGTSYGADAVFTTLSAGMSGFNPALMEVMGY